MAGFESTARGMSEKGHSFFLSPDALDFLGYGCEPLVFGSTVLLTQCQIQKNQFKQPPHHRGFQWKHVHLPEK